MNDQLVRSAPLSRVLAASFLLVALWGTLAPYVGRPIGLVVVTQPVVEVVDHVVPGIAVLGIAFSWLTTGRMSRIGVLAVGLAGMWMTGTHVPLLLQAIEGGASPAAALFHSVPGIMIFLLATATIVANTGEDTR